MVPASTLLNQKMKGVSIMAIDRPPWEGIHTTGTGRGKLKGKFPAPESLPDISFNNACALHTIMAMLEIVHDRLQRMDEKLDKRLPE